MKLNLKSIPDDLSDFRRREALRKRSYIRENAYEDSEGIIRWQSKGNPIPESTFRDAYVEQPPGQVEARQRHTDRVLREYRENPPEYTEAQKAEMRSAFGGKPVVNVITGQRII